MRRFTITITGTVRDDVSDQMIYGMAAAAEVQVTEPELFETIDVQTETTIVHEAER